MTIDELAAQIAKLTECVAALVTVVGQPQGDDYTLYSYLRLWLDTYKKQTVKPHTLYSYDNVIRRYIQPNFADVPLRSLTGVSVQNSLARIPDCRQKETAYFVLLDALGTAYKNGFTSVDIMATVTPYKHVRKSGHAMTLAEQAVFIQTCAQYSYGGAMLFALYTGCRRGEVVSLDWSDVDLSRKLVRVRGTKTTKSDRVIPLSKQALEILQPHAQKAGKVFPWRGEYLGKCMDKMRLPFVLDFKDLRTTFATRCMEKGMSDVVISTLMGHSSIHTTKKHYEKVLPDFVKKEVSKLNF